jgi:oxygen-independent coproporphyrinogen-3 oxidase
VPGDGGEEIYLESIAREMEMRAPDARPLDTLYIGGGTPSVLSLGAWRKLMDMLDKFFTYSRSPEVTVEANPGSLTEEHARMWRAWRVNRVSLGVQSMDGGELALLGRAHSASQASEAVSICVRYGYSVSADLMFGLPGIRDDLRTWAATLRAVTSLKLHHISIYQLSIEPGTPFGDAYGDASPASDGYVPYRYAQWMLPKLGYGQYEVASFALPGAESRHNLNYWDDGAYIGIGPSAWSCVDGVRFRNARALGDYAAMTARGALPVAESDRVCGEAAARQAAVLALRTKYGINWERFSARYGAASAKAVKDGLGDIPADLVASDGYSTFLTKKGLRLGNAVWSRII